MGTHLPIAIVASYLLLIREGKVLLAKRINTGYWDDYYGVPAGHGEEGESFSATLIREIEEEIGVRLDKENIKPVHIIHRKGEDGSLRIEAFLQLMSGRGISKIRSLRNAASLIGFP
ncbi:MAG: NUDIX domain-containing protein [Candidatus Moraniibacteriota bacterium]